MPELIDAFVTIEADKILESIRTSDTRTLTAAARNYRAFKTQQKQLQKHIKLMRGFLKHAEDMHFLYDESDATYDNWRLCREAVREAKEALKAHNQLGPMLLARFIDEEHARQARARRKI